MSPEARRTTSRVFTPALFGRRMNTCTRQAPDLQASYIQQAGRLDYTAVVRQSDGQQVWNCEHITHPDSSSAIECARREVARRTAPEKHSKP